MKKLLAIITAFAFIAALVPAVNAGAEGAVVAVSSASGQMGETITVALSMRGTGRLCGASVDIVYDAGMLGYTYHTVNSALKADYLWVKSVESGHLRISFTDVEDDIEPVGPLIYLNFQVKANGVGTARLLVEQKSGALFDHSYIELDYSTENGEIRVLPAFPKTDYTVKHGIIYLPHPIRADSLQNSLPAGATVAKGNTAVETGRAVEYGGGTFYTALSGDINCDGQVSTADFLRYKTFLKGLIPLASPSLAAADMDGNGMHNGTDALRLKALLAGI